MSDIAGYRLLFDPATQAPPRPAPLWPQAARLMSDVLITYAFAVIVIGSWLNEFSRFLVQPLMDALRGEFTHSNPFSRYPSPATLPIAATLLALPIIAVQVWTLFARRALAIDTPKVLWWRIGLTIGAFGIGAAFSHYLVFPLIWPLLPPFGLTASSAIAAARSLDEFAGLHVAIMLVGGLGTQMPMLVALAKRLQVRA